MKRLLVACEFSGIVREAFKIKGWDVWSCDLLDTEIPGQHYKGDVRDVLGESWDMMIAHPPCTYLSYVGMRHWNAPGRAERREEAMEFFMMLVNAPIEKICVENPLGYPVKAYRKQDQIIHPYYFGSPFQKRTCLWLKNLPILVWDKEKAIKPPPLYILNGKKGKGKKIHWVEGISGLSAEERQKARSKTFPEIANAMAQQWG
jgi:hypothetical protein